jgi:NAD(P)-dependent dehydrogenase (short-subunit alcohol dehydrogenase family)
MEKVVLITGGTRGIGLGVAVELAKAGFHLALNGVRDRREVQGVLEELKRVGAEADYFRGNLSVHEERVTLVEQVIGTLGHLHVLVNNAGVAPLRRTDLLDMTEESYNRVLDINLKGAFFLTQLVARHMIEKKKADPGFQASIINISSISASVASINRGEYCISKAGLSMATRLWAVKMGEFGIPVYEIQPGIIESDMTRGVKEKYTRLIEGGLSVQKRWGLPEDVGKVAAAMAMGSMPYSTGQVVMVDGGLTIPRL